VLLYAVGFLILQYILFRTHLVANFPNELNLTYWDAGWYKSIADKGYQFDINSQSNTGFYYLFLAIWRVSHANPFAMSAINITFFAIGFSLLATIYKLGVNVVLLWLTFPTIFYAFIPYSEALFFLLSSLCIWGIYSGNSWLTWVALFMLSLTRATAIMLMPAFLFMELISNNKKEWKRAISTSTIYYFSPMLAGTVLFILIQYWETGVWFAYFIQQSKHWGHKLNQPEFPLRNSSDPGLTWLGAMVVFSCLIAAFLAFKKGKQWFLANEKSDKILTLSICYLIMNLFLILFINVPSEVTGGFRYVMTTPFFMFFYSTIQIMSNISARIIGWCLW
jgi:hypothetical protein